MKISRKYNKFKRFLDDSKFEYGDFTLIFKTIYMYIYETMASDVQINEYVPNYHIAETFLGVLEACEMESMHPNVYHFIPYANMGGYNSVRVDRLHLYSQWDDGLYYKNGYWKLTFIDVIGEYFDLDRLEICGISEIHRTYQKLCSKNDLIRNNLILRGIHMPHECYAHYVTVGVGSKVLISTRIFKEIKH